RYPSLDVAYFSFDDDDDCEINGDLNKLDEQLLLGHSANSSTEYEGAIKRSDDGASHLRRSKATSDNYLPRRHSVLINSSAAFKVISPDLIFVRDSRSRGMSRREAGRLPSLLLSYSTPVDRRIKEDAPLDTVRDLKRARSPRKAYRARQWRRRERERERPPVYMANVGSNSSHRLYPSPCTGILLVPGE
ncbi:hypothetical protein ALC56_00861, partial [Trachymyrmex septentrionalis]